jgi:toxin YoeB
MIISFESSAFDDFNDWAMLDKKCHKRIVNLIKDISRNPY